jgi:glycosyltransferase involved in cell wall biosynthesis
VTPPARATRLSAFLIVHDEERHLPGCLDSLRGLVDEIVVLDDGSRDRTVEIARAAGARVEHRAFDDFGHQKQAALELTRGEWVLSIDADERVTPELAEEIRRVLADPAAADGYWIRREILYLGARLRHGGAGSDWVLRLARRARTRFALLPVHEHLLVDGSTRRLRGTMDHLKYRTLDEHIRTMNRYTTVIADRKRERGGRFQPWHLLRIPWELFVRLVVKLGILDGRAGIVWAGMAAFYGFLKYAKMWSGEPEARERAEEPRAGESRAGRAGAHITGGRPDAAPPSGPGA